MSYAEDLAKDRDKYRRQRDALASHLKFILDAYGGTNPTRDAPMLKRARTELKKIYDDEAKAAERLLKGVRSAAG